QQLREQADHSEFTVAEPLFYCSERRCLVVPEAEGVSLQEVFVNGGDAIAAARRVARAMAAFHQTRICTKAQHSKADQIDLLNRAANLLRWGCPESIDAI